MAWTSFLLGRPGYEYVFEVSPETMQIDYDNLEVINQNLVGNLRQSIIKVEMPTIQIASSYLSFIQRNQLASLQHLTDGFLSFQCRDDWRVYYERVTVIDTTHVQLANTSATLLSEKLVAAGFASVISVQKPFTKTLPTPAGGSAVTFDPGTISYDDATQIITLTNALSNTTDPLYVDYIYKGWLVKISKLTPSNQGGWIDRSRYDFQLVGA